MIKKSGIYKIEHIESGKKYIGSAIDIRARRNVHFSELRLKRHCNQKLQRAWDKYGEASFLFGVVEYVEDKTKLLEREQYYIDSIDAVNAGYNIALIAGSHLGLKRGQETKDKISKIHKGKVLSLEVRKKMSLSRTGVKFSDERRKQMSKYLTGRKFTPEHLKNMSLSRLGKKPSAEARKNMSLAQIGRKHTPESLKKMSDSKKGRKISDHQINKMRQGRMSKETRAKFSAWQTGRKLPLETRRRICMRNRMTANKRDIFDRKAA